MIFILDPDSLLFPDPQLAEADGFLAIGGDVSPERLRAAYSSGIFPWSAFDGERELYWWAPRPRFVLRPAEVHISHSMRQLRRSGRYRVTFNTAFARVVDGCRTAQNRHQHEGAWLSEPLMASLGRRRAGGRPLRCAPPPPLLRRQHVQFGAQRLENGTHCPR